MENIKIKKMVFVVEFSDILLRVQAVQVLAQFNMNNHLHQDPDSNTLPARLIHEAGRDKCVCVQTVAVA